MSARPGGGDPAVYGWMDAGVVDSDSDEARGARLAAEFADDPHPPQCSCRPCQVERSGLTDAEIRGTS